MGLASHLVDGHSLDPKVSQNLHRLIRGDIPVLQVPPVVGIHILVKPSVRQRMPVGLDLQDKLNKPDRLRRLPKCPDRLIGNLVTDPGDLKQFFSPYAARRLSLLPGQQGKAAGKIPNRPDDNQHCFVKTILVNVLRHAEIQL